MKKLLKDKNVIVLALGLVAAILAIVVMILGISQSAMVQNTSFTAAIIVPLILGVVVYIASIFLNFSFVPLIMSALYSLSFGFIIKNGAEVINDRMQNIQFSGGNFEQVVVYFIMMGIVVALSVAICFIPDKKGKKADVAAA